MKEPIKETRVVNFLIALAMENKYEIELRGYDSTSHITLFSNFLDLGFFKICNDFDFEIFSVSSLQVGKKIAISLRNNELTNNYNK